MLRKASLILSLMMALVIVAFWVGSFFSTPVIFLKGPRKPQRIDLGIYFHRGDCMIIENSQIRLFGKAYEYEGMFRVEFFEAGEFTRSWPRILQWAGLTQWRPGRGALMGAIRCYYTPLAWPFVLSLIYPCIVMWYVPLKKQRRQERNLCIHCAYDLTGNESGICPECGRERAGR